jgi:hypothetical protein
MIEIKKDKASSKEKFIGRQTLEILEANAEAGKFGPRIAIKAQIEGTEEWVRTWVSASQQKINELCAAVGLPKPETNFDESTLIGRCGVAVLTLGKENANGKRFLNVEQWVAGHGKAARPAQIAAAPNEPEIPF